MPPEENAPEWLQTVPELLREAPFLKAAESPEDALAKIQHAASYMGRAVKIPTQDTPADERQEFYQRIAESAPDLLKMPTDEEDPEQLAAFNRQFGVPEDTTEYKLPEVDDWVWDDGYVKAMRDNAQSSGLNAKQFKQLMTNIAKSGLEQETNDKDQQSLSNDELKKDWGGAYEERMQLIAGWMDISGAPDELREQVKAGTLPVENMTWLHETAKAFRDDPQIVAQGKEQEGKLSPLEAQEKVQDILKNPAYFDALHPQHSVLKKRMHEAQLAIAGGSME